MSMEYRKAAQRDAERAKLMRRAAALLRELDGVLSHWDLEGHTVAIAGCVFELERAARECDGDALVEFENTDPIGVKL